MPETELPGETHARAAVATRFATRLSQGDDLLAFALSVVSQGGVTITRTRGIRQLVPSVVFGLYMRACKSYRAILLTARAGLGEDAFSLGRSLFETAIAVFFILRRDHTRRAQMYVAHLQIADLRMVEKWKGTRGIRRMATKARLATMRARVARAESTLGPAAMKALRINWSGKSLELTAQQLGWGAMYQLFYRRASRHGHASDLPSHLAFTADGAPILHTVPSPDWLLDEVLGMTFGLMWGIVTSVNERFGLGHKAALEQLKPPK